MKSVGEVMAIGRNFQESVKKHFVVLKLVRVVLMKIAVGTEGAKERS
jgi:carbamoylphosphate synthase large subunit